MKTLQWFKDRIGKRIYRDHNGCPCESCTRRNERGIVVAGEYHAKYLYDISCELMTEYRDLK